MGGREGKVRIRRERGSEKGVERQQSSHQDTRIEGWRNC